MQSVFLHHEITSEGWQTLPASVAAPLIITQDPVCKCILHLKLKMGCVKGAICVVRVEITAEVWQTLPASVAAPLIITQDPVCKCILHLK